MKSYDEFQNQASEDVSLADETYSPIKVGGQKISSTDAQIWVEGVLEDQARRINREIEAYVKRHKKFDSETSLESVLLVDTDIDGMDFRVTYSDADGNNVIAELRYSVSKVKFIKG